MWRGLFWSVGTHSPTWDGGTVRVGEHLNSSSEMKKLEGVSVPHSLLPVPPAPHLKQRKLTTFLELHSLSRSRACRYGYICVDICVDIFVDICVDICVDIPRYPISTLVWCPGPGLASSPWPGCRRPPGRTALQRAHIDTGRGGGED